MNHNISNKPSKDIRTNFAKISALTRENPVTITINEKKTQFYSAVKIL